jgi:peptidyl-prolyl cis-trans isomerase C
LIRLLAMVKSHSTPLVLLAVVLLAACDSPQHHGSIVAQVGDAVLTVADLETRIAGELDGELDDGERQRIIENWVREELLYQEALARQLDQKAHLRRLLEEARRSLLVADLLNAEFEGREVPISEDSILHYYEQHKDEFLLLQPQVHARHILLATLRDANTKVQALQRGESFAALAQEHSRDQDTKFLGGDLGYFSAADDPILWESCRNLKLDSLSKPIRTEYGYHIIQILDRQETGTPRGLDQVKPQIVETLVYQEHQQRLEELIARLKANSEWAIHDQESEELP